MVYTVGEMAKLLGVTASTLRYYDKEGLLPFVERSSGGIRMFRESDIEWLRVIECMKKAGMSIKDIRQYIELALKGDDTIELRLSYDVPPSERGITTENGANAAHIRLIVEYKCWGLRKNRKGCGELVEVPQRARKESDVPKQFHDIRRELKNAVIKS